MADAEAGQPAPVYAVFQFTPLDHERLGRYLERVASTRAGFDIRVVARGAGTAIEGDEPRGRFAVIRFGSAETLQEWYASDAYQAIVKDRTEASETHLAVRIDGVPGA